MLGGDDSRRGGYELQGGPRAALNEQRHRQRQRQRQRERVCVCERERDVAEEMLSVYRVNAIAVAVRRDTRFSC